jgi:hypothetical protein
MQSFRYRSVGANERQKVDEPTAPEIAPHDPAISAWEKRLAPAFQIQSSSAEWGRRLLL